MTRRALLGALASATRPGRALARTAPRSLLIVPLGALHPDLTEIAARVLRSTFRLEIEVGGPLPFPAAAWYAPRKRWRAEKILEALDRAELPAADRIAAITDRPISTTKGPIADWGIAGLGTIGGRSSVSTAYLFAGVERKRFRRYLENLVLHEVGHTLGLDHCDDARCIMADAQGNAIRAAERSTNSFCPRCTERLGPSLVT
jgi:archaemetzincin